jgi:hypothetical protein
VVRVSRAVAAVVFWRGWGCRFAFPLLPRPSPLLCRLAEAEEKETMVVRVSRAVAAVGFWDGGCRFALILLSLLLPRPPPLLCRMTEAGEKETVVVRVSRAVAAVGVWSESADMRPFCCLFCYHGFRRCCAVWRRWRRRRRW